LIRTPSSKAYWPKSSVNKANKVCPYKKKIIYDKFRKFSNWNFAAPAAVVPTSSGEQSSPLSQMLLARLLAQGN
jgi:hypothetical protein